MPETPNNSFPEKAVFLIDGSSFLYRGFYAYPDLKRSDGFPTNAIFIVLRILLKVIREKNPEHIAFYLDGKGKTFRNDLYDNYKANRPKMPEALAMQIEPLKEAVKTLGIQVIVSENAEADDLIASAASKFKKETDVVILGSDKDLKQCLDKNVYIWDPGGKKEKFITLESFEEETGLTPAQWPDYQAIIGDSADNIPGVPGVGPKTADKIMKDFPTLESITENFDSLAAPVQKKFKDHLENIFMFRELTRLKTDLENGTDLEKYKYDPPNPEDVIEFLKKYEFRTLLREFIQHAGIKQAEAPQPQKQDGMLSLLDMDGSKPKAMKPEKIQPSDCPDLSGKTVGLFMEKSDIFLGVGEREIQLKATGSELAELLKKAELVASGDIKAAMHQMPELRDIPLEKWFDISLAAYLLSPEDRNYSVERLSRSLENDPEAITPPEGAMGLRALALYTSLSKKIKDSGLDKLMRDLEVPLIPVLMEMEDNGIMIDKQAFSNYLDEVSGKLDGLTSTILELAGENFNIRSSQQMAHILFDKLELKPAGKTSKGAFSTAVSALEKLSGAHPIIDKILEYRKLEKLRSTYLSPLPELVDKTNRLHTTFNQMATATGRLSSSRPNLQNIPIRGPQGGRMRACFVAAEGKSLISADYSQIELRVLAHYSKDPALLEAFSQGQDIHSRTAALIYEKDDKDISPDERRNAKAINFGLIYGMGPQKLSREIGVTLNEAKGFIATYFEKLATLKTFYDGIIEDAKSLGHVTTLAGRRRLLPEINSRNTQMESQARRQAINTVIQGSAADVIKLAMLRAYADQGLRDLGAKLILQVHDELLIEVDQDKGQEAGESLKDIMQTTVTLDVPLKVDMGVGHDWSEAH